MKVHKDKMSYYKAGHMIVQEIKAQTLQLLICLQSL